MPAALAVIPHSLICIVGKMLTVSLIAVQVPFIHWFGKMPRVQGVVMTAAPVVTPYLFGRAGRQFFLGDVPDDGEAEPLIVRPPCL